MFAVYAASIDPSDPISGLRIGELPDLPTPPGWVRVKVKAAALNHHDLWSLRGIGLPQDRLPMVLGCDGAGVTDDGDEVIVHGVIAADNWTGDETHDPKRSLLSERHPGTLAEWVSVPARNLVAKPAGLGWAEAACLPTAYLTAYRMLFTTGGALPGQSVLVQGCGGGVATAAIILGAATGLRVFATGRDEVRMARAKELGALDVVPSGTRLGEKVDLVIETVGDATWSHSLRSVKPGGKVVVAGATSGANPPADLARVFFSPISILGSTMGTRGELANLAQLMTTGVSPVIDSTRPMTEAKDAFEALADGNVFGKAVLTA